MSSEDPFRRQFQAAIRSLKPRPASRRQRPYPLVLSVCLTVFAVASSAPRAHAQGKGARPAPASNVSGQRAERAAPARHPKPAPASPDRGAAPVSSEGGQNEATPESAAEYRTLIETALNEFKLTNWPEARLLFRRAHELNPNARTQRGIGMVSYEMRDYVPAVLALSEALHDERQPLTPAQRKECEDLLSLARTFIMSYDLKREPSALELTVDGAAPAYDADGRLLIAFGEHTLQASAPGYRRSTTKLSVQGGGHDELSVILQREEPKRAGLPAVNAQTAPHLASGPALAASSPSVVSRHGGLRYTWVALGASAAFGVAAGATWYGAKSKFNDMRAQCRASAAAGDPCVRGKLATDSVQRLERVTDAMLGLSAASLVAAAILMPFEWPRERRLALDVGPRQLGIRGSF